MDIENKIRNIIEKYNYNIDGKQLYRDLLGDYLKEKIGKNASVAVMCAGIHTIHLLQDFSNVLKPVCFIDNDANRYGELIDGIRIVDRSYADSFDKIIISTFDYREDVKKQLMQDGITEDKLIDLYDFLEENGVEPWIEYYNITVNNPYIVFIIINNLYLKTQQAYYIELLIKLYLKIRDISSACKYMEEYIKKEFPEYDKVKSLMLEIENLVETIKEKMLERNQRDIVWFWQDGLLFELAQQMPFYNQIKARSLYFVNGYSSTVWTRCVYELILHKRHEIDDRSFEHYGKINSEWISDLEKNGYTCVRWDAINKKMQLWSDFECGQKPLISFEVPTTDMCWHTINYILNNPKPVFVLVHIALECHQPIISPSLMTYNACWANYPERFENSNNGKMRKNALISSKYLSEIMKFYSSMLGDKAVRIYMSDHGTVQQSKSRRWNKDANHLVFIVEDNCIKPRQCEGLFYLYNFDKVIRYILSPTEKNYEDIFSNHIPLQSVDVYNPHTISKYLGTEFQEYCYSFRGVQTLEDRYVLLKNGKEIYNVFPDDYTNYIKESCYQKRIQELRLLAGDVFLPDDEEKFKAARILYQ